MARKRRRFTAEFKKRVALEAALRSGSPEIFNTDQGSQFTSIDFTGRVKATGAQGRH